VERSEQEQGLHNLRQTLSLLRKAWDELHGIGPLLLAERDTIQLSPQANLWVDVRAFDEALDEAYRHFQNRRGLARLNIRRLNNALLLFKAPFLDRFELDNSPLFDEWALSLRERTTQAAVEALALLCEYFESRGEYSPAADTARRIAELVPWDEGAHSRVMRLLAVDQHFGAAQNQYIQLKRYLKRNLDVEPESETTALYRQIRAAAAANRPFSPKVPPSVYRLPAPIEFVGRERELNQISDMLANPKSAWSL
jgi:DNA-binding SARP family transcriptional activator